MRSVECGGWSVEERKRRVALRALSTAQRSTFNSRPRRGMTLIELLVVIIIITTLVAAVIPLLSPANDDRRLREATRGLNTYITGAQARAASSHRPFGIAIKRLSGQTGKNSSTDPLNDNGVSVEVQYVEQPAPYSGFDANSRASVALYPNQDPTSGRPGCAIVRFLTRGTQTAGLPKGWQGDLFPSGMIRPGDVIEINGTQFELLNDTSANTNITVNNISQSTTNPVYYFAPPNNGTPQILARPLNDSGQQIFPKYDNAGNNVGFDQEPQPAKQPPLTPPYWTNASPYKILRQPTLTSDEPYQLPEGTAIDLRASGVGADNYFYVPKVHDNDQNILVLFTPEGRVARVTYSKGPKDKVENDEAGDQFDQAVVDNVYLLVGRRDRIEATDVITDPSLDPVKVAAATTQEAQDKLREPINWLNGTSRWVVIGSQSGRVVTVENAHVDVGSVIQTFTTKSPPLAASSEPLRNEQIKSAREFTHEMKQVGGR
jgi:prepilin-type N-terminal cleavage/methylation domain-containing protein